MLDRLNGMFAIAIWDNQEREIFLARDRLGIKPLYYSSQPDAFYFASEEKALFAAGIRPEFDPAAWEELLCFRYVAGEGTPYVGVKRLLPGHYLRWKDGRVSIRRWWNLSERAQARAGEIPRDPFEWFKETFDSAVKLRRISDVPVGVLLSGGLDSSSVAASLSTQGGAGLASFTVRFAKVGYDEGALAREVADRWALEYKDLEVSPEDLLPLLNRATRLTDAPLVHASDLHLLAISYYAKKHVTVLLSGEGADETLGGYVRYQPLRFPRLLGAMRGTVPPITKALGLNGRLRKLRRFLELGSAERFVLFNACEVLPEDLSAVGMEQSLSFQYREGVLNEARSLYPGEPMRQAMYSDQHTFLCSILDRNDRMTMGASIECRVPFLDYRLVETLAAMPSSVLLGGRRNKHVLRRSLGDRLPESIRRHRKWGFGAPWAHYMRNSPSIKEIVNDLPRLDPVREGPFDSARVRRVIDRFFEGENDNEALIRQLLMVSVWHQQCLGSAASAAQHS
jgi:asparagine synthase (glutamine-hydrolysing)